MAKQTVNIGTAANDGTGDPLRTAFDKLNDNFDEVYGNNFVTQDMLSDDIVGDDELENQLIARIVANDAKISYTDSAAVALNTAKVTNATHTGDVTGSTALSIASGVVNQNELANRYKGTASSSSTGSQNLDCSSASFFLLTGNITTATLTLQGLKSGQSVDILLTGTLTSAAITLDTDFTTDTIYRVGDNELDTSTSNIIQVTCLDDTDSNARLAYSVATFQVDATP